MRDKHVDDVSLHAYIHTYIGTANLPYVTLVFGARSGSPRINSVDQRVSYPRLYVYIVIYDAIVQQTMGITDNVAACINMNTVDLYNVHCKSIRRQFMGLIRC